MFRDFGVDNGGYDHWTFSYKWNGLWDCFYNLHFILVGDFGSYLRSTFGVGDRTQVSKSPPVKSTCVVSNLDKDLLNYQCLNSLT